MTVYVRGETGKTVLRRNPSYRRPWEQSWLAAKAVGLISTITRRSAFSEPPLTCVSFPSMTQPRFTTGDLVRVHAVSGLSTTQAFMDALARNSVSGIYEVTAVLLKGFGQPQYRVKRGDGTPELIVRENQLVPAIYRPQPKGAEEGR